EVDHLPQALLWTASSIGLNLASQRLMGNRAPLMHMVAGKTVGASISAGLVVAARGFMPGTARRWDQFTTRNIFLPATKAVGKVFGIEKETVDRMAEKRGLTQKESWREEVAAASAPARER